MKTVRLNFGRTPPYSIAIDAVQISGPAGSQWASDARASSDNSASASAYAGQRERDTVESLRAESPVSEWSENWLAYSPFDAIVLNATDIGFHVAGRAGRGRELLASRRKCRFVRPNGFAGGMAPWR